MDGLAEWFRYNGERSWWWVLSGGLFCWILGLKEPSLAYWTISMTPKSGEQFEKDRFNLQRFVEAQNSLYEEVLAELRSGVKRTHWIWFIFPQIEGLGLSATARKFAISSLAEAEGYVKHPVLGPRLRQCTGLVNLVQHRSVEQIFGYPDKLKFRSSMTLFARATADNGIFNEALQKYFEGKPDPCTIERLGE